MCVLQWSHYSQCTSLQSTREQVRASIKVRRRVILSGSRAVGQAYWQSESSQRALPADGPRQPKHSVPKKPNKVSCEEPHKFLQFVNIIFLFITATQKIRKTSFTSRNSRTEQRIPE